LAQAPQAIAFYILPPQERSKQETGGFEVYNFIQVHISGQHDRKPYDGAFLYCVDFRKWICGIWTASIYALDDYLDAYLGA
jgi:hypothetical protein